MSAHEPIRKGRLTIILGYAAGVGKTYKMLEEGHQLVKAGRRVVIGYFEPHGRSDTIERAEGLEIVPRAAIDYRGRTFEEMDVAAILARRPEVCLVDELPHTNIPGSARAKRWEDVLLLLGAGIDVLTTMNIQHLESLNDEMREITGVQVRETIPDWVVKRADGLLLVDLPPQALLNRLQRGVVYPPDKAEEALENFFKEPTLAALREMALREAAHEVEVRQPEPPAGPGSKSAGKSAGGAHAGAPHERILIHISEAPSTAVLIRRGRRVADYLKADCFAVCVLRSTDLGRLPPATRATLEQHLEFARKLHIQTQILEGKDPAQTLVEFARSHAVTQLLLAKPARRSVPILALRDFAMRVVRLARDMQVTMVAERRM